MSDLTRRDGLLGTPGRAVRLVCSAAMLIILHVSPSSADDASMKNAISQACSSVAEYMATEVRPETELRPWLLARLPTPLPPCTPRDARDANERVRSHLLNDVVFRGPDRGLREWRRAPAQVRDSMKGSPFGKVVEDYLHEIGVVAERKEFEARVADGVTATVPVLWVHPRGRSCSTGVVVFNGYASAAGVDASPGAHRNGDDFVRFALQSARAGLDCLLVTSYDWGRAAGLFGPDLYLREIVGGSSLAPIVALVVGTANALQSLDPNVERIVATGLSDGGLQATILAAVDDRVRATQIVPGPLSQRAAISLGLGMQSEFSSRGLFAADDGTGLLRLLVDRPTRVHFTTDHPTTAFPQRDEIPLDLVRVAPLLGGEVRADILGDIGDVFGPSVRRSLWDLVASSGYCGVLPKEELAVPFEAIGELYDHDALPREQRLAFLLRDEVRKACSRADPPQERASSAWQNVRREELRRVLAAPAATVTGRWYLREDAPVRAGAVAITTTDGYRYRCPFLEIDLGLPQWSVAMVDSRSAETLTSPDGGYGEYETKAAESYARQVSKLAPILRTNVIVFWPSGLGPAHFSAGWTSNGKDPNERWWTLPAGVRGVGGSLAGLAVGQLDALVRLTATHPSGEPRPSGDTHPMKITCVCGMGPQSSTLASAWSASKDQADAMTLFLIDPLSTFADLAEQGIVEQQVPFLAVGGLLDAGDVSHLLALSHDRHVEIRATDERYPPMLGRVSRWLTNAGLPLPSFSLPSGESHKRPDDWWCRR